MTFQAKLLCAVAVSAFAALAATSPAQALTPQECSAKYQAAKTAGTLGDQKWNDFRQAQCDNHRHQRINWGNVPSDFKRHHRQDRKHAKDHAREERAGPGYRNTLRANACPGRRRKTWA